MIEIPIFKFTYHEIIKIQVSLLVNEIPVIENWNPNQGEDHDN